VPSKFHGSHPGTALARVRRTNWIVRWAAGAGAIACVAGAGVVGSVAAPAGDPVTDQGVRDAVQRMRAWLYAQQRPDGSWEQGVKGTWKSKQPAGGVTALVTYALLASGESYQVPALTRALGWLERAEMKGTYAVALRAHVWARLPDAFGPELEQDVDWLRAAQWKGLFDYVNPARPRSPGRSGVAVNSSLSRTQYGALAMWEYAKRGGDVDAAFWEQTSDWMVRSQLPDGGWNYGPATSRRSSPADGGMTCAGLTLLCVARQQGVNDDAAAAAVERGLAWLDANFAGRPITDRDEKNAAMFWYGVERVGMAAGVDRLGGRDWYAAGAAHILGREQRVKRGGDRTGAIKPVSTVFSSELIETAFSLAFLARGRVPVWVSKLRLPRQAWNARPDDLLFLSRRLSDAREAELNWQAVGFDSPPEAWRRSPVLYLSSDAALDLTDDEAAALKRYLDLGGLLVANPEGRGGRKLTRSVEALVTGMYPGQTFDYPPAGGPLATLVTPAGGGARPPVKVLGNGARTLVVLPQADWGAGFAGAGGRAGPGRGRSGRDAWAWMQNLYALVSDRGTLAGRLVDPLAPLELPVALPAESPAADADRTDADDAGAPRTLRVVCGRFASGGGDVEPLAWEPVAATLRIGGSVAGVSSAPGDVADVDALDPATLLHLSGVEPVAMTGDELDAVAAFVSAGGTVLLETVGGLGGFADDAAGQLGRRLGAEARWLDADDPVISGAGLRGGTDRRRVEHRRYTAIYGDAEPRPSIGVIAAPSGAPRRGRVLVSARDLSLGALGCGYFRVNGYATASARGLMGNVLLSAAAAGADPPAGGAE